MDKSKDSRKQDPYSMRPDARGTKEIDQMLMQAMVKAGNRIEVDEPPLKMPSPRSARKRG